MTAIAVLLASLLASGSAGECPMNPLPLAVDSVKSSDYVKSYVVVNPKVMSILLTDGKVMRVVSSGCVDSGSVATVWIDDAPPAKDLAAWRKLLTRLASVAFDPSDSKMFADWLAVTSFSTTDRSSLVAISSEDIDMSVFVGPVADGFATEITMSVTYH
jgi:hypothetical protein